MRHRVLLVDDDEAMRHMLRITVAGIYDADVVGTAEEALALLNPQAPHAVVVADHIMPNMLGVKFLAECERRCPLSVRVLLTGDQTRVTSIDAINKSHAFHFLNKPVPPQKLLETIAAAVHHHELLVAEHRLLDTTLRGCVNMLLDVISASDPATFELSQRLRRTVRAFGKATGLPNLWELEMAAALARIGTSTLPRGTLEGLVVAELLSPAERAALDRVPEVGWNLLRTVPRLEGVAEAVRFQSLPFDHEARGDDMPMREQIPLGSRVLKIFFDRAMLEVDGVAGTRARRTMEARSRAYDPALLAASFEVFPNYILSGESASAEVRLLSSANLEAGQTVVADIKTSDGTLLVAAGTRLTLLIVERIRTHTDTHHLKGPYCVQFTPAEGGQTAMPFASALTST